MAYYLSLVTPAAFLRGDMGSTTTLPLGTASKFYISLGWSPLIGVSLSRLTKSLQASSEPTPSLLSGSVTCPWQTLERIGLRSAVMWEIVQTTRIEPVRYTDIDITMI